MTGRRRDERGSGLVELVWLGVLLIVPMVWVVLAVFEVQRGAFAVSAAARASARAYAVADTDAQGRARAEAVARQTIADQGGDGMPVVLDPPSCTSRPCLATGGTITITVRSRVDLPWLPDFFGAQPSFALDATHVVPVGQYRDVGTP